MKKLTLILIVLLSCTLVFAQSITESKVSAQMSSTDTALAAAFKSQTGFQILFDGPEFDLYEASSFSAVASKDKLEDISGIIPRLASSYIMPFFSDDEGVYAYPYAIKEGGISYDPAILAAAGVDPSSIKTWYDFERACQQVKFYGYTPIEMDSAGAEWFIKAAIAGFYNGAKEVELGKGEFDKAVFDGIPAMLDRWVKKGYVVEEGHTAFFFTPDSYNVIPFPSTDGKPYYPAEISAIAVAKGAGVEALAAKLFEFVSGQYLPAVVNLDGLSYAQKYFPLEAADAIKAGAAAILAQEPGAVAALTAGIAAAF